MKKPLIWGGVVVVLAGLVAGWILEGRFAVEGGRLPWAVINDRLDVLDEALARKPGPDAAEKNFALAHAISRHRVEAVKHLLAAGADPNLKRHDTCPLQNAAMAGGPAVMRALLDAGADPKACKEPGGLASEVLISFPDAAPEAELVALFQALAAKGAPLDQKGRAGTALELAQGKKLTQVAAFLKDPSAAPAPVAVPALALRGGKAHVERDDLKQVCDGKGLPDLPPYAKEAGLVSPIAVFEKRFKEYRAPGSMVPRWWIPDDLSHTQLVACVRAEEKRAVKECRYEGAGGGFSLYAVTWVLSVREARTSNEVALKTVTLEPDSLQCPVLKWGTDQEANFPSYSAALTELAGPLIGAAP